MKTLLKLLAVVMLFWSANSANGGTPSFDLENARKTFESALGKIKSDTADPGICSTNYVKALEQLAQKMQRAGDLEGFLAANKEKERFIKEGTAPDTPGPETPLELARLQNDFSKSRNDAEIAKAKKIAELVTSYLSSLDEAKRKLTTDGAIEMAMAVKEESNRVNGDTEIAAAMALAGSSEPKPKAGDMEETAKSAPNAPEETSIPKKSAKPSVPIIKEGLVLYYPFDVASDKTTADKSGKSASGSVHGAKWTADGKIGGAYTFDGRKSFIAVLGNNNIDFTTQFSISVWINPTTDPHDYAHIVSKEKAGAGYNLIATSRIIELGVFNSGTRRPVCVATNAMTFNEWSHIVVTFNSGSKARIYRNGIELASGIPDGPAAKNSEKLYIGKFNPESSDGFVGAIDELMLFNRELSKEEVERIYEDQKQAK